MLLSGINHVAVLTGDTDRFREFHHNVFRATHEVFQEQFLASRLVRAVLLTWQERPSQDREAW